MMFHKQSASFTIGCIKFVIVIAVVRHQLMSNYVHLIFIISNYSVIITVSSSVSSSKFKSKLILKKLDIHIIGFD